MSLKSLLLAGIGGGAAYVLWKAVSAQNDQVQTIVVQQPQPSQSSGGGNALPFLSLALGLLDGQSGESLFDLGSLGASGSINTVVDDLLGNVGLTTSGGRWGPLLKLIRNAEANGNYNIVWGGIRSADHPPRSLTSMTIGQVLAWQDSIDHKYQSEAAGAYQILEDTLRGYYGAAGLTAGDTFSVANQDKIAVALLERKRGMSAWLNGSMSIDDAVTNVAKEWASFPVPKAMQGHKRYLQAGQSYYAGDGLNRAYVPVESVKTALRAARG